MNKQDRCDVGGCGAQAFIEAKFVAGPLHFCRHHGTKYDKALREQAYELCDESDTINLKASLSSA